MKTIIVPCNNCGASVKLEGHQKTRTCEYCRSSVKMVCPDHLTQENHLLRLQNELNRIEKKWAKEQIPLLIQLEDGKNQEPSSDSGLNYTILGAIVFLGSIAMANYFVDMLTFIFGFITSLAFFAIAAEHYSKAKDYAEAKSSYEEYRDKLTLELEAVQMH